MEDLVIKNGLVVTPQGIIRGGVAVRGDKIIQVGADDMLPKANMEVDAKGNYVLPGIIDPHVHVGRAEESDFISQFKTESACAAIAGVTTFVSFVRYGEILQPRLPFYKKGIELGNANSYIDYKFSAYMFSEEQLKEIPQLIEEGIYSCKVFLSLSPETAKKRSYLPVNYGFLYRVMEEQVKAGPPAMIQAHCEEPTIIDMLAARLEGQGRTDFAAHLESRPGFTEAMTVFNLGMLAWERKAQIYIVHVSAKESVDVIKYLRNMGARIYAETCPHYLTLTGDNPLGVLTRIEPPLRTEADNAALWKAVSDGTIDTIGSDHVPLMRKQKETDGVWKGTPGVGGTGTMLPIMLTEGLNKGRIKIERLVQLMSENPARIFGMYPKKGAISPGSDADIVIIDPKREWTITAEAIKSRSDFSIYEGKKAKGRAIKTFVRGKLVAEEGSMIEAPPHGKFVRPLK